ncbi:MAG: alkaline phosphatase family protein [Pseudodesulfovibrio sp.]|uniref:alkaline phosphatase family protein n=1 Tax=Pseudodesulfovibrio sp. TaxID=2035812 RepID=UPI003D0C27FC
MKEIENGHFINTVPLVAVVWLLMMLGCTSTALAQKPASILVVSIDALVPEALGDETSPFISELMRQGVYSLDGMSVDPPLTLVSHAAMVTGLAPNKGGRLDNDWSPGESTVPGKTVFHAAKTAGYRTGFFYAKQKLGYLVSSDVDEYELSAFPTDDALEFVRKGSSFTFVHISGLDQVGPEFGWLSKEYLEELGYIDEYLKPLVEAVRSQGEYRIIILSDHGGHEKLHGCGHPEDFRIPIIVLQSQPLINPTDLKGFTTDGLSTLVTKVMANSR